jgi:hypothetical protein
MKKNNLPTIKQNKSGKGSRKDSASIPLKKRDSKKSKTNEGAPSLRSALNQQSNDSNLQLSKDSISKRQKIKRDTASGTQKNKYQAEFTRLKQSGALKYLPKLSVDCIMMAKRIKFVDNYKEDDYKWQHRLTLKEEYMRRDQLKQIDKFTKNLRVVYDQNERSPYYSDSPLNYIEEKKLIPTKDNDSSNFNSRLKNRGFRRNLMNVGFQKKDRIYSSLNPYYVLQDDNDTTLVFESRFESGNLRRVVQVEEFEYDWFLRNDYNSQGYIQWYYFGITNVKAGARYIFNLKNFFKPDSLYNQGMKPLIYSTKKAESEGVGWYRGGEEIWYYQNLNKRKCGTGFMCTLTFVVEFQYDQDEVYLAHCFPFTYRDCKEHVDYICTENKKENKVNMKDKVRKTELCKSLAGNSLDLIIITSFESTDEAISKRPAIIITGRVHPGESNSSFIVQGILDYLIEDNEVAKELRDKYVFKVIPMLNPDGVILGNYRWSLSGQDLNRQWVGPTSRLFPEIYNTKLMFKKTIESRKIFLFVDVHGHSRKKNVFMYGWKSKNLSDKSMKVFPMIMEKCHWSFSFDDCNFNVQKDKETTGRVVVNREFNVVNSFTLEASFLGPDKGSFQDWHFTPSQLRDLGKAFWIALNQADSEEVAGSILRKLEEMMMPWTD